MSESKRISSIHEHYKPDVTEQFIRHCQSLVVTKLLCHMTRAVQQHRGANMAVLNGDESFLSLVEQRQQSIRQIVSMLKEANSHSQPLVASSAIEQLENEWKTILMGWDQDEVIDNFQFHCYLIESLHRLIRIVIVEQLPEQLGINEAQQQALLRVLFITLPEITENLAMLRGLSTYAAVKKTCDESSQGKIAFLVKEIREKNETLMRQLQELALQLPVLPGAEIIVSKRKELHKLMVTIEIAILEPHKIHTEGSQLFRMATSIIDAYWLAIEQGIQQVDHWVYELSIQ